MSRQLVYRRSSRGYRRKLLKPEPPGWRGACDVDRSGCVRWRTRKVFVTSALAGEIVELEGLGEWTWQIRFLIARLELSKGMACGRSAAPPPAAAVEQPRGAGLTSHDHER